MDDTAEARETAQRKKVATFLTLVGPEAYRLLKSLLSPAIPASKTFPELIEVLGKHLKPKKLIVAERFRFHQRNQSEGETVAQFEAALRKLASTCEFELFLNQALRDQFVCGVRSESTQKKLLCAEQTFEQSVHTALADEIADSEARAIHGREPDYVRQSSVHAVSDKRHSRGQFNHGYGNTQHRSRKVNTSISKSVFGVMAITWVTNVVFVTPYVMLVDVQDISKRHAEKRVQCQQM